MAVDRKAMRDRERLRRNPQLRAYYGWDNLGDVHATLSQLEHGDFTQAAIMTDAMFRDDRFYGVMRTRVNALQSVPLDIKPANDSDKAAKIADLLGGTNDGPSEWDRMFSPPAVGELVKWGACLGVGVGEIIWTTDEGEVWFPPDEIVNVTRPDGTQMEVLPPKGVGMWRPRLRVWHPQFLRWDDSRQRYLLRTYNYEVVLPDVHENPRSDGHWILWCPYGYHGAWLQGLVRALAVSVLDRTWNKNDWSRYNENYGRPIKKAIVPAGATNDQKNEHFEGIANQHGDMTVMCARGVTAEGADANFDIEFAEAKSTGWDTFQARKKENDSDIAIVGLGQNLTTEVTDGKGSLGVDGQQMVRRDYLKTDAGVLVCIRDQGLSHFAERNFKDHELAPMCEYRVDPPEDKVAASTAKANTVTAVAAAKTAGILIIDERAELEDAGIKVVTPEEEAAREAVAAEEAAAVAAQMAPAAGGGGDVGEPDDDEETPPKKKPGRAELAAKRPPKVVKRYQFQGLPIAVENDKGSTREWPGGSTRMQHDYGFIDNGQFGWDEDEVDVYIGPNANAPDVHIVHQLARPTYDSYDEDKVMMGFDTHADARRAFAQHRDDGERAIRSITSMPVAEFHRKLRKRKGYGPIRASAQVDTVRALMALSKRVSTDVVALRALGPKGSSYADRLVENATRLAARALAGDLVAVKQEIAQADGFPDLEKRLLRRFKDMDPTRLAGIIEKVRIMANLSGQLSARKETKTK